MFFSELIVLFADLSLDQLASSIVQLGIGATLSIAFIWFVHHMVVKVIPNILEVHYKVMKEEKDSHQSIASKQIERLEKITETLTSMSSKLDQMDRHVKANHDHVATLREYIIKRTKQEDDK